MELISGKELFIILRKKGITQRELSKVFDVNPSQISQYLNDHRRMPASFIIQVMIYAGIDPKDLIAAPRQVVDDIPGRAIEYAEYEEIPTGVAAEPDVIYSALSALDTARKAIKKIKKK